MLLDSNIIIYSALPENGFPRDFIALNSPYVSDISRVEVLGWQHLDAIQIEYFAAFFESSTSLSPTNDVILETIRLRQLRRMALGDSLIAATAIIYDLDLVTSNTKDFQWIDELTIIDPFGTV